MLDIKNTYNIDIINQSYASIWSGNAFSNNILSLKNHNIQLMCCANNDNSSSILYPRSDTNALAIGAALNYTTIANYSDHFKGLDFASFTNFYTQKSPTVNGTFTGTSCATPVASGCEKLSNAKITARYQRKNAR